MGFVSGYKQDSNLISRPAFYKYTEITSVEEEQQNTFSFDVFPNPAREKFEIRSMAFEVAEGTIELYDMNGRNLIEKTIKPGTENIEIDVNNLEAGVYFCRMSISKKSMTKKIVKW